MDEAGTRARHGGDPEWSGTGRRVTVAAWIGSQNLGDELVFAALRSKLTARGLAVDALSVSPAETVAAHGPTARRRRTLLAPGTLGAALFLGGGGLLQDETSSLNLDLHLAPVVRARLTRRRVGGVGLGAGRLTTGASRARVRAALGGVPLSVRDDSSADLLADIGLDRPVVAADLAFSLPPPAVEPLDRIVACLRPWRGERHRLPVSWRRTDPGPEWFLSAAAGGLDALARRSGLAVHLVALGGPGDEGVHSAVAARMATPVTTDVAGLADGLATIGASRLVVAMRYHAAVAAALSHRPAALIGYTDKVSSLGSDLGPAATRSLRWEPGGLDGLAEASTLVGADDAMAEAAAELVRRERRNDEILDRVLTAATRAGRPGLTRR